MDIGSPKLMDIFRQIKREGGSAFIVGGWVRDMLLGATPKDIDIEVFGIYPPDLYYLLCQHGKVETVGQSFGVTKLHLDGDTIDFSIPRRDTKQGKGHKGFVTEFDPDMSFREASSRRDFTINSMGYDPLNHAVVDFHKGREHIKHKLLVPTSEAFKEDPLRVLRGMQFAARFGFESEMMLDEYGYAMLDEYKDLPVERVWTEWEKLVLKGKKISCGLRVLLNTEWIIHYPELANLVDIAQDPEWHPEGDAFAHTMWVADAAVVIADRENLSDFDRKVLVLAAICHDLGKANTTVFKDGKWRSPGHDVSGVPLAESFLKSIACPIHIVERVKPLVRWHMAHCRKTFSLKSVRKLSVNMEPSSIATLLLLIEADMNGRPPLPKGLPQSALDLKKVADKLGVVRASLRPVIKGKELIALGLTPNKDFGRIIKAAFEAQIEGKFDNVATGLQWVQNFLKGQSV